MSRFIILLFFVFTVTASQAQNRSSLKGKVIDSLSREALEFATVAVVNPADSSLISYTLTTKTGEFILRNLPAGRMLKVVVSYVGYLNYRKQYTPRADGETDMGIVPLSKNTLLTEVVINGERQPVTIRKDTIEFSAEAFKTRPNAVVEDLLKKLPGVQVDLDGTVTVNGRNVKKILVDGKEFFADDIRIATKNLNADLIDKIQVMDDHEDDPDRLRDASQVDKIINLKLKKAIKKSTFGKLYAGGGTDSRFESGGLLNMMKDTLQVSLIAFGNNVNRAGFSNSDLSGMGGFQRSGGSTYEVAGGPTYGLQRVASAGININNDWGKKVKANLMYFYGNTRTEYESLGNSQQFFSESTLSTKSGYNQTNDQNKHNISGVLQWTIDTVSNIRFTPKISVNLSDINNNSFSFSSSNLKPQLNQSADVALQNSSQTSYSHNLSYYRRLRKKGESLNIVNNILLNPVSNKGYTSSNNTIYNTPVVNTILRQFSERESERSSVNLDVTYRRPLNTKITADLVVAGSWENNGDALGTFKMNDATGQYDLFLPNQSNNLNRDMFTYRLRPGITWNVKKNISVVGGLTSQIQQVKNSFGAAYGNLNKNYFFLLPSIRFSAKNISVSYDMRTTQPYITYLQPVINSSNPLFTRIGNPNLEPEKTHSSYISYNNYKAATQTGYNVNLSGSWRNGSTTDDQTIDTKTGAQKSMPVNIDGNYYLSLSTGFNKRLKKMKNWQVNYNLSLGSSISRNYFLLNQLKGERMSYGITFTPNLSVNWRDLITIQPAYNLSLNTSNSTGGTTNRFNSSRHDLNTQFTMRWPKRIILEGSYAYKYNSQISSSFNRTMNIVNASVSVQMLKKDKGQLKLSVYDLLNQNNGVGSYAYNNIISDQTSNVLKQYFMLGYVYNFNKTVNKK